MHGYMLTIANSLCRECMSVMRAFVFARTVCVQILLVPRVETFNMKTFVKLMSVICILMQCNK